MPDREGMPIWEKMQIVDSEDVTALAIPLSEDNSSLSSLIYVILNDENRITGTKNVTNEGLKNIVYDTRYSKIYREGMMNSFIQMDYAVFGNDVFCNIPQDLFIGHKNDKNRLFYGGNKGVYTAASGHDDTGKLVYINVSDCTTFYHCTKHGGGKCDHCSMCQTTLCENTVYAIFEDDPISGFPSGGVFSGGGSGTPMEHTPDPCTQTKVFYRVAPGCGSGGGMDGLEDPCTRITSENTKAKILLDKAIVAAQNTAMKTGISTSTIEKAFTFGKNSLGAYAVSVIINGPAGGGAVSMPATNPNFTTEGGVHNHDTTTYDVPSTGDIYWFSTVHTTNSNFNYYYTNGANTGAEYVYVITNPTDLADLSTNFPTSTYVLATGGWNSSSIIGKDFEAAYNYFFNVSHKTDEEAMELAQAFVIGKYNLGIGISKKDSAGNFQPIFVEEISTNVPTGNPLVPFITIKTYQQTNTCNLK